MRKVLTVAICAFACICCHSNALCFDMVFSPSGETLECPVEKQLILKVNGSMYDLEQNIYGIVFSSSNESVAIVTERGVLRTLSTGYATITASCDKGSAKYMLYVNKASYDEKLDYSKKLTGDMIYSNDMVIANNVAMQSFDVLKNGDLIIGGCKNSSLYFQRVAPGRPSNSIMSVKYAGHGTNFSIEEQGADTYVWFSSFGSMDGNECNAERLISRVKYKAGSVINAEDCTDNYYVSSSTGVMVSTDTENDILAITAGNRFYIYKLSEAKKAPEKNYSVEVVREDKKNVSLTVKAHDLTSITTIANFAIPQDVPIQGIDRDGDTRPMQGFCVYNDKVYWYSGDGTNPDVALSIMDFSGKVLQSCKTFALDDNPDDYVTLGVSQTGYLEPEGIKIRYGKVYLGFIWNLKDVKPWTWRATVIKYN